MLSEASTCSAFACKHSCCKFCITWLRIYVILGLCAQIAVEVVRRAAVSVAGGMMSANAVASGQWT